MKWHLVRVSGEEICWPDGCPCCGVEATAHLAIPNYHGYEPDEVPMYWQTPFCPACIRHAQPIANMKSFNRDAAVYSILWFVIYLVARRIRLLLLSRTCSIRCACTEPAVRHWDENRVGNRNPVFQFARAEYAARFAACNPTLD